MPFFSIIIPTYNRATLLGKAITSVLQQTFIDFELIIVDDGSTDDTKNYIATYTDKRIKYIYQQNGERGKARNNGVKQAIGNYVFFLDSDDIIYPDHLEHAFEQINHFNSPAFFHSRYEEVIDTKKKQVPQLNPKNIKAKIALQNVFACQFFLKREVALDFPFSENRNLKIGEDWEVILKVAQRFDLTISNKVTSAIVHHGERSMEIASAKTVLASRDILINNLKQDQAISAVICGNVFAELTTLAGLSAAIANEKGKAFKLWRKGVVKRPRLLFTRRTLAILKKIIINGKS